MAREHTKQLPGKTVTRVVPLEGTYKTAWPPRSASQACKHLPPTSTRRTNWRPGLPAPPLTLDPPELPRQPGGPQHSAARRAAP